MVLTIEQIAQLKKDNYDSFNKEIAELEIAIADLTNQRDKELKNLQEQLDSLIYQKSLYG